MVLSISRKAFKKDDNIPTTHIDVSDKALKHLQALQISSYSVLRPLSGFLCGVPLFLAILSITWGLIFAFGPVELTVNGVKTIFDESKYLGPGLLWVTGFFVINAIMCLTVFIWHYRKSPKQPRPFGYVYLASLIPLGFAVYNFCARVGFTTVKQ